MAPESPERCHHLVGVRAEGSRGARFSSEWRSGSWLVGLIGGKRTIISRQDVKKTCFLKQDSSVDLFFSNSSLISCFFEDFLLPLSPKWSLSEDRPHLLMWLAYCYFHNGDYMKAIGAYDDAMKKVGFGESGSLSF